MSAELERSVEPVRGCVRLGPNQSGEVKEESMEQAPTGESRSGAKVAISLLAGLVVVIVLLPWHGMDTDPPQCLSIFDYRVPCGAGLAFAAGTATAGVLALLFWVAQRRRSLQTR